jgi:hypothetical protein
MNDDERRELAKTLNGAAPDVLDEIVRQAESFLGEELKSRRSRSSQQGLRCRPHRRGVFRLWGLGHYWRALAVSIAIFRL